MIVCLVVHELYNWVICTWVRNRRGFVAQLEEARWWNGLFHDLHKISAFQSSAEASKAAKPVPRKPQNFRAQPVESAPRSVGPGWRPGSGLLGLWWGLEVLQLGLLGLALSNEAVAHRETRPPLLFWFSMGFSTFSKLLFFSSKQKWNYTCFLLLDGNVYIIVYKLIFVWLLVAFHHIIVIKICFRFCARDDVYSTAVNNVVNSSGLLHLLLSVSLFDMLVGQG